MKKIMSYVITGLLAVLLITVCVLAIVSSSFYNPVDGDNVKRVEIWHDGEKVAYNAINEDGRATIDKILEANAKGYQEKILTSIFLGYYAENMKVEHKPAENAESIANMLKNNPESYFVVFDFTYGAEDLESAMQTLKVDGHDYLLPEVEDEEEAKVKYSRLIMQVSDSDTFGDIVIYLEETNNVISTSSTALKSNYRVTTKGYQTELYNLVEDLFND